MLTICTAGHDHSGPPPEAKWELACVDREGDQPTWGLRPEMLDALSCECYLCDLLARVERA